jgi:hypothetical protein
MTRRQTVHTLHTDKMEAHVKQNLNTMTSLGTFPRATNTPKPSAKEVMEQIVEDIEASEPIHIDRTCAMVSEDHYYATVYLHRFKVADQLFNHIVYGTLLRPFMQQQWADVLSHVTRMLQKLSHAVYDGVAADSLQKEFKKAGIADKIDKLIVSALDELWDWIDREDNGVAGGGYSDDADLHSDCGSCEGDGD